MLGLRSKGIIYDQFQHMRSLFNTSSHEHQSIAASLVVVEGGYLAKAHKPKLSLILLQAWAEEVRILVVLCSKYDNASTVYGKVDNKIRLSYCISSNIILNGLMYHSVEIFWIFLLVIFYVKSILKNVEVLNLPLLPFLSSEFSSFGTIQSSNRAQIH